MGRGVAAAAWTGSGLTPSDDTTTSWMSHADRLPTVSFPTPRDES